MVSVSFILLFIASLLVLYFDFCNIIFYLILILLISVIYSLSILNRIIDLKKIYENIKNKFNK